MAVLQATKTRSIAEASGTAISNFQARKQVEEQVTEQATATMATLQTTQSQAIDQHQSFEMVQTLLLSSQSESVRAHTDH
ncbi:hypothetical protein MMC12_002552 [Toensbergia leucococca]|nr:hypothetical protein [Toensbergia leucococca]